jgi:hypothetical protein
MRNYRDLQVWEKAHKLTLAIYQGDPAFVCLDRSKLGGRLWQKIRRRDARFIQISMGLGIGAFHSLETSIS